MFGGALGLGVNAGSSATEGRVGDTGERGLLGSGLFRNNGDCGVLIVDGDGFEILLLSPDLVAEFGEEMTFSWRIMEVGVRQLSKAFLLEGTVSVKGFLRKLVRIDSLRMYQ
jgi:hypothetical protein